MRGARGARTSPFGSTEVTGCTEVRVFFSAGGDTTTPSETGHCDGVATHDALDPRARPVHTRCVDGKRMSGVKNVFV